LKLLDGIRLSDEASQLAEATFLKKQMYYNMRIKMCKRATSNAIRKANQQTQVRTQDIIQHARELQRQLKAIEREVEERQQGGAATIAMTNEQKKIVATEQQLTDKSRGLTSALNAMTDRIATAEVFIHPILYDVPSIRRLH
jgi:hypothetical protein